MTFQIILIIHVLLALGLITLILMQHGKGAQAGAAFGAGASGSVFGARGGNSFIYKLTAGIATGFFVTSLSLAYLANSDAVSTSQWLLKNGNTPQKPVQVFPLEVYSGGGCRNL